MKKLLFALFALAAPAWAYGQISIFSFNQKGGGFYVHAGTYTASNTDQYDALKLNAVGGNSGLKRGTVAYPKPTNGMVTFGIGGYGISSSIIFGGELNGYLGNKVSTTLTDDSLFPQATEYRYTLKTQTYGVDGMATLGIVAVRVGGLVVRPMVGLGYGGMALQIADNRGQRQYPNYTSGNQENKILWNAGFLYDLGIGADYHFGGSGERTKGFTVGLKLGYRVQTAGTWKERGNEFKTTDAQGQPITIAKQGNSGPYVRISIGLGSCGKSKD